MSKPSQAGLAPETEKIASAQQAKVAVFQRTLKKGKDPDSLA
jgi:hypothetical protein